jgi:hypothetical protein
MRKIAKVYSFFLVIILSITVISCSDDEGPRNAQYITLEELRVTPGYEWFDPEYNNYTPDPAVIDSIKNQIQNRSDDFILYVNPSCNCSGTQVLFPASVKVLHEAGIDEPRFKIYTMYNKSDNHPYMDNFIVNDLPSFFTVIDTLPKYSINDSLRVYMQIRPDSTWRVEDFVFRAIKD